jgi:hypothetical protein
MLRQGCPRAVSCATHSPLRHAPVCMAAVSCGLTLLLHVWQAAGNAGPACWPMRTSAPLQQQAMCRGGWQGSNLLSSHPPRTRGLAGSARPGCDAAAAVRYEPRGWEEGRRWLRPLVGCSPLAAHGSLHVAAACCRPRLHHSVGCSTLQLAARGHVRTAEMQPRVSLDTGCGCCFVCWLLVYSAVLALSGSAAVCLQQCIAGVLVSVVSKVLSIQTCLQGEVVLGRHCAECSRTMRRCDSAAARHCGAQQVHLHVVAVARSALWGAQSW